MKILEIELDNLDLRTIGQWPILIRSCLVFLTCGFVLFTGKMFFLEDQWTRCQDLNLERVKKQKEFENLCQYANHLESYRAEVEEVKRALSHALRQLPGQHEQANLLELISEQASLQGLQFRGMKPEAPVMKEFYREQPIEFALLGNFHGLGEFAAHIANMPRIVTLHDFSLRKEKKSDLLEIFLIIKTYWSDPTLAPTLSTLTRRFAPPSPVKRERGRGVALFVEAGEGV